MKSWYNWLIGLLASLLIIFLAYEVFAAYSISAVTVGKIAAHAQTISQTGHQITTKADVLTARQVAGYRAFSVWIYNSGTANLTDLDILLSDENANWSKAPVNWTDAQPFLTDTNSGCTVTLAAGTKCVVAIEVNPGIGWINVQAAAAATAEVSVTLIGYVE